MKIVVRAKADRDLDDIFTWIAKDNRALPLMSLRRLRNRIGRLATPGLEQIGRPGLEPGTRELVEPPYIVVYEVHEARNEIEILTIVHGARDREGTG